MRGTLEAPGMNRYRRTSVIPHHRIHCMSAWVYIMDVPPVYPLLPVPTQEPLPSLEWLQGSSLVLQCSSLGSLTEQWLHSELATSFMAHAPFPGARPGGPLTDLLSDSLTTYTLQSPQEGRGKSKAGQTVKGLPVERLFFVWPTVDVSTYLHHHLMLTMIDLIYAGRRIHAPYCTPPVAEPAAPPCLCCGDHDDCLSWWHVWLVYVCAGGA
jgi:hypothetical protein